MYEYHSVVIESLEKNIVTEGIITSFKNNYLVVLNDEITELSINDKVSINIFNKMHGCMNYEGFVKSIKDNTIDIDSLIFIQETQRRKHPRITTSISLNVNKIIKNSNEEIALSKPILMKAKNISIDGILLESFLDIPENVHFNINFPLDGKSIDLLTTTRRKYQENNMHYYGCSFDLMDIEQNEFLRKFIYQNYLHQIRHKNPNFSFYRNNKY